MSPSRSEDHGEGFFLDNAVDMQGGTSRWRPCSQLIVFNESAGYPPICSPAIDIDGAVRKFCTILHSLHARGRPGRDFLICAPSRCTILGSLSCSAALSCLGELSIPKIIGRLPAGFGLPAFLVVRKLFSPGFRAL